MVERGQAMNRRKERLMVMKDLDNEEKKRRVNTNLSDEQINGDS